MSAAQPQTFRLHLSMEIDGRMLPRTVDVTASTPEAARKQVLAQAAFKGAIILKTKKVRQ